MENWGAPFTRPVLHQLKDPAIRFPAHVPTSGKESKMDSRTAPANARRGREEDKREVEFYVRAKTCLLYTSDAADE